MAHYLHLFPNTSAAWMPLLISVAPMLANCSMSASIPLRIQAETTVKIAPAHNQYCKQKLFSFFLLCGCSHLVALPLRISMSLCERIPRGIIFSNAARDYSSKGCAIDDTVIESITVALRLYPTRCNNSPSVYRGSTQRGREYLHSA